MKTSPNNTREIESFLKGDMPPQDKLLFRARLLIDPFLRIDTAVQKTTYTVVKAFGRRRTRRLLEKTFDDITRDPAKDHFMNEIKNLF